MLSCFAWVLLTTEHLITISDVTRTLPTNFVNLLQITVKTREAYVYYPDSDQYETLKLDDLIASQHIAVSK